MEEQPKVKVSSCGVCDGWVRVMTVPATDRPAAYKEFMKEVLEYDLDTSTKELDEFKRMHQCECSY